MTGCGWRDNHQVVCTAWRRQDKCDYKRNRGFGVGVKGKWAGLSMGCGTAAVCWAGLVVHMSDWMWLAR